MGHRLLISIPGYVIATNVPRGGQHGWILDWFGNSFVIATFKLVVTKLFVPWAANLLSHIKIAESDDLLLESLIKHCKTQVTVSVIFEVVTVCVAPAVTVLLFDEVCTCVIHSVTRSGLGLHALLLEPRT